MCPLSDWEAHGSVSDRGGDGASITRESRRSQPASNSGQSVSSGEIQRTFVFRRK